MKSLAKILGELVLAGACGAVIGASVGHSVEAIRKERYDAERERQPSLFASKYEMDRRVIYGTGVLGGVLTIVMYIIKGHGKIRGEEDNLNEEERKGL